MTHKSTGEPLFPPQNTPLRRTQLGVFFNRSDPIVFTPENQEQKDADHSNHRRSNASFPTPIIVSPASSPSSYYMSPFNQSSPYSNSPWNVSSHGGDGDGNTSRTGIIGSLVREEGHIYSLASSGDLLYTGSDSKNIRVWKDFNEFSGFKSSSGLVKAIVISGDKVFTGHQDGKIRVWKYSDNKKKAYKRVGNLPTTRDFIRCSINPSSYVEVRRRRNVPWIKHYDAVACMSLDEERGLLYSGSWDKSLKVWRLSDSKCLESVNAHDDAINAVVAGFNGLVFTGSADGTVKVWRRELLLKSTKHEMVCTLLDQDNAVTAVAVNEPSAVVYAGSSDGLVNFWERQKQTLVHGGVIRGHKLAVLCLAAAGSLLFTGSADKSICVWRREGGGVHSCVTVLTGHDGPVKCLAVHDSRDDDDRRNQQWVVYSGSLDKSVKLWRVSEKKIEDSKTMSLKIINEKSTS